MDKKGPDMTEFRSIVDEYNTDMENIQKLKIDDVKKSITDWLAESNLDKLRGQVLGVNKIISDDDYLTTVREYFRNDDSETIKITVDNSYVRGIISHAKKLEDIKKESIKDRDNLITLLSKTEKFFDRTIATSYRGTQARVNVDKINVDDNKFSREDRYIKTTDDITRNVSSYATLKYKQVNKIASMINLVACERVNALKDQIKQERVILRRCLFGDTKEETTIESYNVFPNLGDKGLTYDAIAMESNVLNYKYYHEVSKTILLEEAKFLIESIQTQEVHYLLEADMTKGLGKIKTGIANIIQKIVKTFREKAIGNVEKYGPWIDDIKDGLEEKAKKKNELKMANFFNADYVAMANKLSSSIDKAYNETNYDSTQFASSIISSLNSIDKINDDSSRALLINYFRTGKADDKLSTVTLNGENLSKKVNEMCNYVSKYDSLVKRPADTIKKSIDDKSEKFKVTESMITGDTYIDLIGQRICESEIVACIDYVPMFGHVITEVEKPKIGGSTEGLGDAGKANAEAQKAAEPETDSATKIVATAKEDENGNPATGVKEDKTNNKAVEYKKNVDRFYKSCISFYLKAREEQFLAYVNAIAEIDGARPVFKDGKYVPKAERNKESKEATKTESSDK